MKSLRVISVFLVLFAHAVRAQEERPQASNTGRIRGRVVNEKGQPIYGANVLIQATVFIRVYGAIVDPRETTTDRDGTFEFTGLPPVLYSLSAEFPAHTAAPRDPDSTEVTSYRIGDNVTLILIKGGVITGRVSSASGDPLVGVRVSAQKIRHGIGQRPRYGTDYVERTTDDRGIYRIYGLPTGRYFVSASYGKDAPTYAPSSTRDTALQIDVQAGQEATNIDIRYRGDKGYAVTGTVSAPPGSDFRRIGVTLTSTLDEGSQWNETRYQSEGSSGFSFLGLADGDYHLTAQSYSPNGGGAISTPKRITVRGADITGVELVTKPLGSISGRVVLEDSNAPECKGKRRAVVTETLVSARHNQKEVDKDQPQFIWSLGGPVYPNEKGDIALRSLVAGQYQIVTRLFAKDWYLRSVSLPASSSSGAKGQQTIRTTDAASNWTTLRSGDRLTGLVVTLSEGAASLQGQIKLTEGQTLPERLYVYLVPVEREKELDVLRFFASLVSSDRTVAVNHIPPGRYWIVVQPALEGAMPPLRRLRLPDEKETRAKLRRDAEQTKVEIEFKPCQNVTDYELPLKAFFDAQRAIMPN